MTTNFVLNSKYLDVAEIKRIVNGNWPATLMSICSLTESQVTPGVKGPCPKCGGRDRFVPFADVAETGGLYCRRCHAKKNSDGFASIEWLRGCSLNEAVKLVAAEIGIVPRNGTDSKRKATPAKTKKVHSSLVKAAESLAWSMQTKGILSEKRLPDFCWRYHNSDGSEAGAVLRWNLPDGRKEIRQVSRVSGGWVCSGMPELRPLFNVPKVIKADEVWLFEGEKSAEAAAKIGLIATTPSQGSKSPHKTDWSTLSGKRIHIVPDNDDPGEYFAREVVGLIRRHAPGATISVRRLIDDWPEIPMAGDIADWLEVFKALDTNAMVDRLRALPDRIDEFDVITTNAATLRPDSNSENRQDSTLPKKPQVELTLDERTPNDQVIEALANRGDIFDHYGALAIVIDEQVDGELPRKTIQHLSLATLREIITSTVEFFTVESKEGTAGKKPARIPRWCYEAVLARGTWSGIRPIRGIVTSPVLRADGSILQSAGYDAESGLYADLSQAFPDINEDPSMDDVERSIAKLFDLVIDFPFRDDANRSGWLASLLTPLGREAYRGCTGPLFLFDANVRGSGKSLLADINALIVSGREATRLTAPRDDDEARKRITALVNDSDRIVLIDNIAGRFGCASLDAALTGTVWKDRRLGHTELIEAPLRMAWYASGNNVILEADTARRVCHIRLESPLENPEDREGFKYPDIRKHVQQHRPELLQAALTILRGFIAAGRPVPKAKPWGSFEGWSDLVRAAILFCGCADPGETRTELRATSDSEAGALRQMLTAVKNIDTGQHGLKATDMLKIATGRATGEHRPGGGTPYGSDDVETMRDAIENFCGRAILKATAQHLGNQLSHFRNRVVDQMAFDCTTKRGTNHWFVQSSGGPGVPGGPDSANL